MKIIGVKTNKVKTVILFLLVIAQFVGIAIVNFTRSYGFMDYDTAFTVRQGVEMWQKGIFLKDFNYSTSMEIDCAAFFAMPLYILTNNLNLALGVTHCVFNGLIIYLIYVVFSQVFTDNKEKCINATLLAVLFVFTPYASKPNFLDWSNMLFISAGYYEFRVISMLSLLGVMLMCENNRISTIKFTAHFILSMICIFWTSLSVGNYALGFIILPFVLKVFIDMVRIGKIKIFTKQNVVIGMACVCWFLSSLLRSHYGVTSHRMDLNLINARHLWDNIQNMVTGIFLLFNGLCREGNISIFSLDGIAILLRFGIVVASFVLVWLASKHKESNGTMYAIFNAIAFVNLGVLSLTLASYGQSIFEHRYHIQWTYLMLILVASVLVDEIQWINKLTFHLASWGSIAVLLVVNIVGFSDMFAIEKEKDYVNKLLAYADLGEADSIIFYNNFELSGQIRATDLRKNSVSFFETESGWQADTKYYNYTIADQCYTEGRNILVCSQEEFERLPEHFRAGYELIYNKEWIGNFYLANRSPFDAISGLPLETSQRSIDFPYSPGYTFKGEIDSEGRLIAESTVQECILSGPYTNAVPGIYDIVLYYRVDKEAESSSFFDVSAQDGQQVLVRQVLDSSSDVVVLDNVSITGTAPLEFRVWQGAGGKIVIDRIEFIRVGK